MALTFGHRQFPARIGLSAGVFNRAVHASLIPPPDPTTRRWPAAVVEDVLTRTDEIRAAVEAGPGVGAARAAAMLSIRFDMHVEPRTLLELDRMGLIKTVGQYQGHAVYDARALKTFDDRAALQKAVRNGRLLMRDEAAEYLRIRRSDVEHLLRAGLLTPATWVRASWQSRQSLPDVALIRVGDLDALRDHPAIDWRGPLDTAGQAVGAGRSAKRLGACATAFKIITTSTAPTISAHATHHSRRDPPMTQLVIATNNYQAGGYHDGTFDMRPLQQTFAVLDTPPALILFCEAKYYRRNHYEGLRLAEKALTKAFDVPYAGLLGTLKRGPIPPAIFFNTELLSCLHWPGADDPDDPDVFDDQRNYGRFRVAATGAEFGAWVAHFDPYHGCDRLYEAKLLGRHGTSDLPVIGGGDLQVSASGPQFPQRDWQNANHMIRRHKGIRVDRGTPEERWQANTAPLDYLIGEWDPATRRRTDGAGYHAIAELAWLANPDFVIQPSIIDKPGEGGPDLIDYLLVNDAMRPHVIASSYQVHIPDGPPFPSDHHLVTAEIDLTRLGPRTPL